MKIPLIATPVEGANTNQVQNASSGKKNPNASGSDSVSQNSKPEHKSPKFRALLEKMVKSEGRSQANPPRSSQLIASKQQKDTPKPGKVPKNQERLPVLEEENTSVFADKASNEDPNLSSPEQSSLMVGRSLESEGDGLIETTQRTDSVLVPMDAKEHIQSILESSTSKGSKKDSPLFLTPNGNRRVKPKDQPNHSRELVVELKDHRTKRNRVPSQNHGSEDLVKAQTSGTQDGGVSTETLKDPNGGDGIRIAVDNSLSTTAIGDGGKAQAPVSREMLTHLSRQIRENTNSEIVRNARIILKDNDVGEIRLRLRPESLGEVRISLALSGNRLGGQILVENQSVKEIFQSNLENLLDEFREEGYESTGLDVNVRDQGGNAREQQFQEQLNHREISLWYEDQQPSFQDPLAMGAAASYWDHNIEFLA